jgi:hypothetical protein
MHLRRLSRPSTLCATNNNLVSSSQDFPAIKSLASSDQSSPLQPHLPLDTPHPNQQYLPAWVSSLRFLLQDRSIPANKLQQQELSAAPISSEKTHRDLVEWSARVGSIERELRFIMRDLVAKGVGLEDVLMAILEDQDILVVKRLWMK